MSSPLRRVSIPHTIREQFRGFALSRALGIHAHTVLHSLAPAAYPDFCKRRVKVLNADYCRYQFTLRDADNEHVFSVFFDDNSSPERLFIRWMKHDTR